MRHAKTEPWNDDGDKSRRLEERGVEAARAIGGELAGMGLQLALVSTAVRTRQTFEALGLDIPAEYQEVLYREGAETMLQRISETDDAITGLLVVGHSPTIPALASQLTYAASRERADELLCGFPTSAWAEFTFDGSWADLDLAHLDHVSLGRTSRT